MAFALLHTQHSERRPASLAAEAAESPVEPRAAGGRTEDATAVAMDIRRLLNPADGVPIASFRQWRDESQG